MQINETTLTDFDRLVISGAAQLDGALKVSLSGKFTPVLGDSFEILTAAGGLGGTKFSTFNPPALAAGLLWNVDYGPNHVLLEVVQEFSADFDVNGVVDGNDLTDPVLGWEARFGADLDGSDFLQWQQQLGSGVPLETVSTAVPEPTSLLLASLAVGLSLVLTCGGEVARHTKLQDG